MAIPRSRYATNAATYQGVNLVRIASANVTVYDSLTGDVLLDTIYKGPTGTGLGNEWSNPFTTNSSGDILFYLADPKPVDVKISGTVDGVTVPEFTIHLEPVIPRADDLARLSTMDAINLLDYARGADLQNGWDTNVSVIAAMDRAIDKIVGLGLDGYKLVLPPGKFMVDDYIPAVNGLTVQGTRGLTILKRKVGNSDKQLFLGSSYVGITLDSLTFDGAYNETTDLADFFVDCEVTLGGTGHTLRNVRVQNFNAKGINGEGEDHRLLDCVTVGPMLSKAEYDALPTDNIPEELLGHPNTYRQYGGLTGFLTPGTAISHRLYMRGCQAIGTRSAGMTIGGVDVLLQDCTLRYTHLQYWPYDPANGYATVGAQFGVAPTWDGVASLPDHHSNQPATRMAIKNLRVLDTAPTAPGPNCIEIGDAVDIELTGMMQIHKNGGGVIVADDSFGVRVDVDCSPTDPANPGFAAVRITNSKNVQVRGTFNGVSEGVFIDGDGTVGVLGDPHSRDIIIGPATFENIHNASNTGPAIRTHETGGGTVDDVTLIGCVFRGNDVNINDTATMARFLRSGNHFADGDSYDDNLLGGLTVARDEASTFALTAINNHASGQGALLYSASGNVLSLQTAASSGIRLLTGWVANAVQKAWLGLNASDEPTVYAADGTSVLARFGAAISAFAGTIYPSGQTGYGIKGITNTGIASGGASITVGANASGLLWVLDPQVSGTGLVLFCQGGGAPALIVNGDTGTWATSDTASRISVFRDGSGNLIIKNNTATNPRNIAYGFWGA